MTREFLAYLVWLIGGWLAIALWWQPQERKPGALETLVRAVGLLLVWPCYLTQLFWPSPIRGEGSDKVVQVPPQKEPS